MYQPDDRSKILKLSDNPKHFWSSEPFPVVGKQLRQSRRKSKKLK